MAAERLASRRIWYPIVFPMGSQRSEATRSATPMAARRRGCKGGQVERGVMIEAVHTSTSATISVAVHFSHACVVQPWLRVSAVCATRHNVHLCTNDIDLSAPTFVDGIIKNKLWDLYPAWGICVGNQIDMRICAHQWLAPINGQYHNKEWCHAGRAVGRER